MAGMMQNMAQNMIGKFMENSPLGSIVKVVKSGGNPMPLVQQMSKNDPMIKQGLNMVSGKNVSELEQYARNMAAERGVNVNQIIQSLGFSIPQGK